MDCTVWNERQRTRLACRRPGTGAHRDIERGKVPSAARVACIARSACTSLDQNLVRGLPLRVGGRSMRHVRWVPVCSCGGFAARPQQQLEKGQESTVSSILWWSKLSGSRCSRCVFSFLLSGFSSVFIHKTKKSTSPPEKIVCKRACGTHMTTAAVLVTAVTSMSN